MKGVFLLAACGGALLAASGCGGGGSGPTILGVRSDTVVFVSTRDGLPQVYSMNFDGTNQTRLSKVQGTDSGPRLSRDGSTIVFSSDRDGNSEIYKMGADGSGVARLTNDSGASEPADTSPAISPDGATIAWATTRGGSRTIYLMNVDGSNQRPLEGTGTGKTPLTGSAIDPSFSPDGKSLVYLGTRSDGYYVLVVRNLATGAENVISPKANAILRSPRFNRAGNVLFFYSYGQDTGALDSTKTDGTGFTNYSPLRVAGYPASASTNANDDALVFQTSIDNSGTQQIFTAKTATFATKQKLTTLGDNSEPATAG